MRFIRTRAAWLVALTLTLQVGIIASACSALCCVPEESSWMGDMACCKEANGAPHVCHLRKPAKPGVPQMKSCCTPDQQALAALFGFVGLPELSYALRVVDDRPALRAVASEQPLTLVMPPDGPPPRV